MLAGVISDGLDASVIEMKWSSLVVKGDDAISQLIAWKQTSKVETFSPITFILVASDDENRRARTKQLLPQEFRFNTVQMPDELTEQSRFTDLG